MIIQAWIIYNDGGESPARALVSAKAEGFFSLHDYVFSFAKLLPPLPSNLICTEQLIWKTILTEANNTPVYLCVRPLKGKKREDILNSFSDAVSLGEMEENTKQFINLFNKARDISADVDDLLR